MNRTGSIMMALVTTAFTVLTGTTHAAESLIPNEMVYVGHGPSVMGMDKEPPGNSGKQATPYDRTDEYPLVGRSLERRKPCAHGVPGFIPHR